MSRRFRAGSIRRQIAALAIGPITALVTLNAISEWALREDLESVSYAKATALTMETIINQVRASTSIEQEAAILETTSKTGLGVEEVAAEELLRVTRKFLLRMSATLCRSTYQLTSQRRSARRPPVEYFAMFWLLG
ncbi:hypothetical protein ACQY1H_25720 (plasmid) [Agrobacterium vitis]|uniref:hypothetical protein n=1 Tax=Agrobacterium vitis TaxID=373 RepID=UPI003D2AA8E5